jgi:hypothetical protein
MSLPLVRDALTDLSTISSEFLRTRTGHNNDVRPDADQVALVGSEDI